MSCRPSSTLYKTLKHHGQTWPSLFSVPAFDRGGQPRKIDSAYSCISHTSDGGIKALVWMTKHLKYSGPFQVSWSTAVLITEIGWVWHPVRICDHVPRHHRLSTSLLIASFCPLTGKLLRVVVIMLENLCRRRR
jgi:hypothetical protein